MKLFLVSISVLLFSFSVSAQNKAFARFSADFVKGYNVLNLPQLELSYAAGLQHIQSADNVRKQEGFFTRIKKQLASYNAAQLSDAQKIDYKLIQYETELNLERIALERQWLANKPAQISTGDIITIANGKAWYAYLLKRWVADDVTPDQIYQFGLGEVKRVQGHIEDVCKRTGLSEREFYTHLKDSSFFTSDPKEIQQAFEHTKNVVYANLNKLFSDTDIPPLKIVRGENSQLAQTPGYYNDNTFCYNLFDKPYCKRQYDWLFIHEGVPGHHYQSALAAKARVSDVQQLFFIPALPRAGALMRKNWANNLVHTKLLTTSWANGNGISCDLSGCRWMWD